MQTTIITNFRTFSLIGFNLPAARSAAYKLLLNDEQLETVAWHVESELEARAEFAHAVRNEEYRDNFRAAYADDAAAMAEYEKAEQHGCCGSVDYSYMIGERLFHLGCNYGH